jgi:hypothetical protein
MTATARHHAAVQFIEQNTALHLDEGRLLELCAAELVGIHGVEDAHRAHGIAVAALADFQSRTHPAWIDITTSTSFVVRVVDPLSKRVATFTAAELIRLAQASVTGDAGERVDQPTGREHWLH